MSTLQERIAIAAAYAKKQGIITSKAEIGRKCKTSKQTVGYWFNGPTQTIDGPLLLRVASYLKVNPNWLAGENVSMEIETPQPAQSQSQSQGNQTQSQAPSGLLTKSPRSQALESFVNKLDELEQQQVINEEELSLLRHTVEVLTKSKTGSNKINQTKNSIFKE